MSTRTNQTSVAWWKRRNYDVATQTVKIKGRSCEAIRGKFRRVPIHCCATLRRLQLEGCSIEPLVGFIERRDRNVHDAHFADRAMAAAGADINCGHRLDWDQLAIQFHHS